MRITCFLCALLAPAVVRAAAFPWSLPEPTLAVPEADRWSPAPTAPPQLPGRDLFRRSDIASEGDNTCGFLSGIKESSITCYNTNEICAINTFYGVHGCCDPKSMSSCVIPTSCIASTAMSTDCPDSICSSNKGIAKCTGWGMGECSTMIFIYPSTTMKEVGCAASAGTITIQRSWGVTPSAEAQKTVTVTTTATPTPPNNSANAGKKNASLGPIIGGTVGGCVAMSAIAFGIFLWWRRRKTSPAHRPPTHFHSSSVTEYDPMGFQQNEGTYIAEDHKLWLRHQQYQRGSVVERPPEPMPQYPGMNQYGILEVDGRERPVEAPDSTLPPSHHVS